jgi:hypothetical protein
MLGDIMLEKLNACYERLQTLDITPTLQNMEKLLQTLYELREVYQELQKGANDGRSAVDSE